MLISVMLRRVAIMLKLNVETLMRTEENLARVRGLRAKTSLSMCVDKSFAGMLRRVSRNG